MEVTENLLKPIEGKWFTVEPDNIDQKLFFNERVNHEQEKVRQRILYAFSQWKNKPEKYAKSFQTLTPIKTWDSITLPGHLEKIEEIVTRLGGDHIADLVEQSLEWAQRIYNGESWENLCNNPDTATYFRLIVDENGKFLYVGYHSGRGYSTRICEYEKAFLARLDFSVPVVVR